MKTPLERTKNLLFASGIAYIIMGIGLYLGLNYNKTSIYSTPFVETMITIGLIIVGGLAINFFLLVYSCHESQEDKDRKNNKIK